MDSILRAAAVYLFLLLVFRLTGKRTLGEVTTFDFVLLLIIGEATQQALLGNDFSITTGALVITTLVGVDLLLGGAKKFSPLLDRMLEGMPLVIVEHGRMIEKRMGREGVSLDEVLEAARQTHGLERLEQIKFAVLERNGKISIIPSSVEA